MVREVVGIRRMPPWHADPLYGEFENDISLSPEDVRTLVHWIEQGFVRGEGADPLLTAPRPQIGGWLLGTPDRIITPKDPVSISADSSDQFVEIKIDQPVEKDLWVRAFDLRPSNFAVVHHGNVIVMPPESADPGNEENQKLYRLSGRTMDAGQMVSGYSPGSGPFVLPKGTGVFIPQGARLLFRMHYIPTGKPETDLPQLGLYLFNKRPANVLSIKTITNRDIKIPAGVKEYKRTGSFVFKDNVLLITLTPHLHYRGRSMKFTLRYPDGTTEVVLSVPRYKFAWQRQYVFKKPKEIPAGTQIVVDAVYDNSAQNEDNPDPQQEVLYGPQSGREMFTAILYYIVKEGPDAHGK